MTSAGLREARREEGREEGLTGPDARGAVALDDVTKVYGRGQHAVVALDRLSLRARPGEFVCLVGASGCGKSTILSLVAGLDVATAGSVAVSGGRPGLMFQQPALLPWRTVRANVELALQLRGVPGRERRRQALELLGAVHLREFADKRPHQLSGGMQQRAALARTLALRSPVLLMDEPFGALDAITRDLLHDEVERIWLQRRPTVLFVTHNVREAVRLADRVVLLSSRPGRVVADVAIDLPRPRRTDAPEVARIAAGVTDQLRAEVRRHGQ